MKHGLARPGDILAPFDETLTTASTGELAGDTFELHAGAACRDFGLVEELRAAGTSVEVPAARLTQGEQLAFYARRSAGRGPRGRSQSGCRHARPGGHP